MKQQVEFFYGTGPGLVRVSDRIYQPIDVGSLVKREPLAIKISPTLKIIIKTTAFLLVGFLLGGFFGEFLVRDAASSSEGLGTIFSAGAIGIIVSGMIELLSFIPVLE